MREKNKTMRDYETACPECESIELEYIADGIIHCLACDLEYKTVKSDTVGRKKE